MSKMTQKLSKRGKSAAKKAYTKLEAKVMAAVGRRVVKRRTKKAVAVGKKAVKRGLIAGGLAAAGVLARELRNRKKVRA